MVLIGTKFGVDLSHLVQTKGEKKNNQLGHLCYVNAVTERRCRDIRKKEKDEGNINGVHRFFWISMGYYHKITNIIQLSVL